MFNVIGVGAVCFGVGYCVGKGYVQTAYAWVKSKFTKTA